MANVPQVYIFTSKYYIIYTFAWIFIINKIYYTMYALDRFCSENKLF